MKIPIALLLLTLSLTAAFGAETATPPTTTTAKPATSDIVIDNDGPTFIIPTNGATLIVISNNVRATDSQSTLTCDRLTILTKASTNEAAASPLGITSFGSEFESIVAEGNVIILQEKGRAIAEKAYYDQAKDNLTLTGSKPRPRVETLDGNGYWATDVIIFDRRTGITTFIGKGSGKFSPGLQGIFSLPGTPVKK